LSEKSSQSLEQGLYYEGAENEFSDYPPQLIIPGKALMF
jgi:hypothetical protein